MENKKESIQIVVKVGTIVGLLLCCVACYVSRKNMSFRTCI